jgi:hypothetical protein
MGANIAGIYGAQIFRQDDRPRYRRGFSINIAILAAGLFLAVVRYVSDVLVRRRARNSGSDRSQEPEQSYTDEVSPVQEKL